eukprot:263622_1
MPRIKRNGDKAPRKALAVRASRGHISKHSSYFDDVKYQNIVFSNHRKCILSIDSNYELFKYDLMKETFIKIKDHPEFETTNYIKIISFDDINNVLYLLTSELHTEYVAEWNVETNTIKQIIDISYLNCEDIFSLKKDLSSNSVFIPPLNELHLITYKDDIAYHYKYDICENQLIQVAKINKLTNNRMVDYKNNSSMNQFYPKRFNVLQFAESLNKLILIVMGRSRESKTVISVFQIYYCDVSECNINEYQWKSFEFPGYNLPPHKTYPNCFIGYEHILFIHHDNHVLAFDLLYGESYDPITFDRLDHNNEICGGKMDVINTLNEDIHFIANPQWSFDGRDHFKLKLSNITPQKLKDFYKKRNNLLIFGYQRPLSEDYNIPSYINKIILTYYNLF